MSGKNLRNLSGNWSQNKDISSDVTPVLALQGFNVLTRNAVSYAPIDLSIRQPSPDEMYIDQTTTASIPAVKEEMHFDWKEREQEDAVMGKVKSKSRWSKGSDISDAFLKTDLEAEQEVAESEVESPDGGWKAHQILCMEGERLVRKVVTTKESERVETKLCYDFNG